MNQESKETIQKVFQHFDKDNSGFIDINEIVQIALELGQEIFKDLDINKDGKISFEEFWDWWQFGRSNKLEKLVFFKLKAMNLFNKAHSEFVRMGGSLESKYDKTLDNHYIALNMGESKCGTNLQIKVNVNNETVNKEFNQFIELLKLPEDFFGFIFKFKSSNPKEMTINLEKFTEEIFKKSLLQDIQFLSEDDLKFTFTSNEQEVIVSAEIQNSMISQIILLSYNEKFLDKVGENFYLSLELQLGLMKSLKQLFDNLKDKFVAHFMQGFLFELKLDLNSGFLKQFRNLLIMILEQKVKDVVDDQDNFLLKFGPLLSLIYGSKIHIVFKDMQDVNKFFQGIGVEDLLQDQPSAQDMLEELKDNIFSLLTVQGYDEFKEKHTALSSLIEFFKGQTSAIGEGQFNIKLPKTLVTMNYRLDGLLQLAEFFCSK